MTTKQEINEIVSKAIGGGVGVLSEFLPIIGPYVAPLLGYGASKLSKFLGEQIIGPTRQAVSNTRFMMPTKNAFMSQAGLYHPETIRNYGQQQAANIIQTAIDPTEFTHNIKQNRPIIGVEKFRDPYFEPNTSQNPNAGFATTGFSYPMKTSQKKTANIKYKNVL